MAAKDKNMILFHTIYSMPLNRYSRMDATGNIRLVSRIWLPKFILNKQYLSFQVEVGRLFGGNDIFENDIIRLTLYNRITLYKSALLALTYEPENATMVKWWVDTFGGDVDLERLKNEIERMVFRYKELEKVDPPKQKLFEDIVGRVEVILGYSINRNITLFEFKSLYDNALKKGKE